MGRRRTKMCCCCHTLLVLTLELRDCLSRLRQVRDVKFQFLKVGDAGLLCETVCKSCAKLWFAPRTVGVWFYEVIVSDIRYEVLHNVLPGLTSELMSLQGHHCQPSNTFFMVLESYKTNFEMKKILRLTWLIQLWIVWNLLTWVIIKMLMFTWLKSACWQNSWTCRTENQPTFSDLKYASIGRGTADITKKQC